jgi:hypothetical protein
VVEQGVLNLAGHVKGSLARRAWLLLGAVIDDLENRGQAVLPMIFDRTCTMVSVPFRDHESFFQDQ